MLPASLKPITVAVDVLVEALIVNVTAFPSTSVTTSVRVLASPEVLLNAVISAVALLDKVNLLLSASDLIVFADPLISNLIKTRDNSCDPEDSWPYIENTSRISDRPIFEPVPRVVRLDWYAFVIVLSALA